MSAPKLSIVIVGGGLGGLAAAHCLSRAGHDITLFEASTTLEESGAGLQLSPNATRLLRRWGIGPELAKVSVCPRSASLRRYESDERFGCLPIRLVVQAQDGMPWYNVHRAKLHRMLLTLIEGRVNIRTNTKVIEVYPGKVVATSHDTSASANQFENRPRIMLSTGEIVCADFIIGADGVKSVTRKALGEDSPGPILASCIVYRAILPAHALLVDPDLKDLILDPEVNHWAGPGAGAVGYPFNGQADYNMVFGLANETSQDGPKRSPRENADFLRNIFIGWNPRFRKLLGLIPSALRWHLEDRGALATWIHPDGCVALLGDAAHFTLPFGGQGAAMAFEDAAVLGGLFSSITTSSQVPSLLRGYEKIRKNRCSAVQEVARGHQKTFQMPDGPAQQQRDLSLSVTIPFDTATELPAEDRTLNVLLNSKVYGYDADQEVDEWLRTLSSDDVQ